MIEQESTKYRLKRWVGAHATLANLMVALIYLAFAHIGHLAANAEHLVSPIWPPMGLVLAAVYLAKYRLFPGIALAVMLTQLKAGCSPLSSAGIMLGVLAAASAANYLLDLLQRQTLELITDRVRLVMWIFLASFVAALISSTVGTSSLFLLEESPPSVGFTEIWYTWFMGDFVGALILAHALLSLRAVKPNLKWVIKLLILGTLAGLTFSLIFYYGHGTPLLFLALPILLIAYHWFGSAGSALASLGFVIYASFIAFNPDNFFHVAHYQQILLIDLFILALAVTSLTLSAFYQRNYSSLPAALFLIGWLLCGWLYYSLRTNAATLDQDQFADLVYDAEQAVLNRLRIYTDALQAGAAHYMTNDDMSRDQWRAYVTYANIPERYRGINGLGFITPFTAEALPAYVASVNENELIEFTIKNVPDVERPPTDEMGFDHYIITHIEPLENNYQALGLDTASEANRQFAGRRARDTGLATMTNRITLVQDGQARPGFLVYVPMYQSDSPLTTVAERRAAFVGWSYAPFITEHFLEGVLNERANQINFEIYDDIAINPQNFVYGTMRTEFSSGKENFDQISQLDLAGQKFSFGWRRGPKFQTQDTSSATIAAASLAVGTSLLVGIFVNLQSTKRRAHAIAKTKTAELLKVNDSLKREIYDRKRAESGAAAAQKAAEAANMAKSEFLATMSHEIRTPMNSVLGFAELLAGSELSHEQRTWASYIQSSGKSLLHIINDILDFSKIEANKLELEHIPFSLDTAIKDVVNSFATLAGEKGILINYNQSETLPKTVVGDPIRLKQIITNLIANSLKFTRHGSVTVSPLWNDKGATIRVADTGIGIPADKVVHLFDKFTQVDSSTTRKFGGTGLGLAICKQLTNLMGGHIHAESEQGEGTTMVVQIPFETTSQPAQLTRAPFPIPQPQASSNAVDVLLVDDNSVNQQLGVIVLRRLGCNVSVAQNGMEALELLKSKHYPLIFLDCQMPIMDGYETSEKIREWEASGEHDTLSSDKPVVIIALTADASERAREECHKAGMDEFICKPIRKRDFQEVLSKHS